MKKKLNLITITLLSAALLNLSSCLKDDGRYINFAGSPATVDLPLESYNGVGNLVAESYNIVSTPTLLPCIVNVSAPNPLTYPLKVTLKVDTAALTAYNAANNTSYTLLPAADYTVSSWVVTIPANVNLDTLKIYIKTSAIDPSQQYLLPISIADASGVTINQFHTLLYNVQVKNIWDGQYTVTGSMNDVVNSALTGAYPITANLVTTGATTDVMYSTTFGAYAHDIVNGANASYYGSFAPVFTFNTSNDVTAVVNYYGQPASNTRSAVIDPTNVSSAKGTPGTVGFVFTVKYIMVQANAGGNRTYFNETWTYTGSR